MFVALYNCNENDIIENKENEKMLVENVDFISFYKNQEFKNYYNEVIDNKKILNRNTQNIGVSTNLIKHIKTKELETYTFLVEKKNLSANQFENLVITKDLIGNEISAAFLKYNMSTELLLDSNGKPYPFQGTLEVLPVEEKSIEGLLSRSTTLCFRVGVLMCNDNRGEYTSDHQVTEACTKPEHIYTAQSIECATTFGPPNFTDEADGGGSSVPIDSGTTGGSSTSTTSGGTIITSLIPSTLKDEWFDLMDKLTDEQQRYLYKIENAQIRKEIGDFFEKENFSKEAEEFIIKAITEFITFTSTNYPGSNEGLPFKWWEDETIMDTHVFFNRGPYDLWRILTKEEKKILRLYPAAAVFLHNNKKIAEESTVNRYNNNGLNDVSDAYRHAYFNALNTREMGTWLAKKLSDAHESETPERWSLEVKMDKFNNSLGHQVGNLYHNATDIQLSNIIFDRIKNGKGVYLNPINRNDPNYRDNLMTPEPNDGTHGISSLTKLTPTF